MWDAAEQKRIRRTFDNHAEAKGWRRDAVIALSRGHQVKGKSNATLRAVCEDFLTQARAGAVLNRSGDPYKPSAVRSYERTLRRHVWPTLGVEPIGTSLGADLRQLVDDAIANDTPAATVTTYITPLGLCSSANLSRPSDGQPDR